MEGNIERLRQGIKREGISKYEEIREKSLLRYYLGKEEKEEEKVVYSSEGGEHLELSESLEIAKECIVLIGCELRRMAKEEEPDIEKMKELNKLLKDSYYYLGRYLFSYFIVAIEFGIPKEKQFYAPREMVLGKVARRMDIFYYKPKGILALNMPQRNWERAAIKQ